MNIFFITAIVVAYFAIGGTWGVLLSKAVHKRHYDRDNHFFQTPLAALLFMLTLWPLGLFITIILYTILGLIYVFGKASAAYTSYLTKTKKEAQKSR